MTIADLAHRKQQLEMIRQQREVLSDSPPVPLSPYAKPPALSTKTSTLPLFPVTPDGFRTRKAEAASRDALENQTYLTHLYSLVASADREGLSRHVSTAATPFQKMLAIASLEHLFLLTGNLEEADAVVQAMEDDRSDLGLEKAKAWDAAAASWARKGDLGRADASFKAALEA